jgi:Flp pilus assembly protein TadG
MTRPQIVSAAVQDTAALVECPRPGLLAVLRRRATRSGDAGASAVEFALVVPLLVILVLGIIDFGVIFAQQLSLNNAVRQGARSAVVSGNTVQQTCAQVVTGVRGAAGQTIAMDTTDIDVTVRTQSADGSTVRTTQCGSGANPYSSTRVCANSSRSDGTTDSILVDATYPASFIVPFPVPGFAPTITLRARAVYRCEFD